MLGVVHLSVSSNSCTNFYISVVIIYCVSAEGDLQKLSHALKILSETEKQLRMSKNQTTWLTVALLQLSSLECSSAEANDPKVWLDNAHGKGENC